MTQQLTCIICPNSCLLTAEVENGHVLHVSGNLCPRGAEHICQELTDPHRTISTNIPVRHGDFPLVSVRLDRPIPKACIPLVIKELSALEVDAPTAIGEVVVQNILGLGSNVIFTRNVKRIYPQK